MKVKFRRGQYLGDKLTGFVYSECYAHTVYGLVIWNYGIFMKLMNPEIPRLAKVSDYTVWAADVGNGHIEKFDSQENVFFIGQCYNLLSTSNRKE